MCIFVEMCIFFSLMILPHTYLCICAARAIESQCYVLAAAQVGQHNEKRQSYGHSLGKQARIAMIYLHFAVAFLYCSILIAELYLISPTVYDPWGELLSDAGGYDGVGTDGIIKEIESLTNKEESPVRVPSIIVSEINLDKLSSVRERMPIHHHRENSSFS